MEKLPEYLVIDTGEDTSDDPSYVTEGSRGFDSYSEAQNYVKEYHNDLSSRTDDDGELLYTVTPIVGGSFMYSRNWGINQQEYVVAIYERNEDT